MPMLGRRHRLESNCRISNGHKIDIFYGSGKREEREIIFAKFLFRRGRRAQSCKAKQGS